MTSIFLQGGLVGLAVAAPVGPIGLLCIRRTLRDGRLTGLATGLGAATADGLYGLVAATGLALSGLLISHGDLMLFFGGALIVFLGVTTILRGLREQPHDPAKAPSSHEPVKAYATTFLLTLANPATILAFVGMISGLSKGAEAGPGAAYWLIMGDLLRLSAVVVLSGGGNLGGAQPDFRSLHAPDRLSLWWSSHYLGALDDAGSRETLAVSRLSSPLVALFFLYLPC